MKKKRYLKRDEIIDRLILSLAFLVAITISIIVSFGNNGKFNFTLFIIVLLSSFALFGALSIILSIPAVKGKIGEHRVSKRLKRLQKKYGGYIINDVIIPDNDNGRTSQIDHIYFSEYGIFCVETKNYAGRIYGKDEQREWTQVLAYGHSKHKLYNPVMQNRTHIERLKKILNITDNIKSIIVFVIANTSFLDSAFVYELSDIKNLINKSMPKIYSDENVKELYDVVQNYKENPIQTTKEHVAEIKTMLDESKTNCPWCKGKLVLRTSKTGNQFYGCENYPKCKFTKKVE